MPPRRHASDGTDEDAELAPTRERCGHAEREVAAALGELVEGEARALLEQWPDRLDDQLVGGERGRIRAEEELLRADLAATPGRCGNGRASGRDECERELRSGIGVRDGSADGAAIPRDGVTDVRENGRERGMCLKTVIGLSYGRADAYDAIPVRDAVESCDAVDVDDERGAQDTHVESGHQALTTRQHLASSPPSASAVSASSSDSGLTYSNRAGFTRAGAPTRGRV